MGFHGTNTVKSLEEAINFWREGHLALRRNIDVKRAGLKPVSPALLVASSCDRVM